MTREYCRDCICLVEGKNGEWICDEREMEVESVTKCPEREAMSRTPCDGPEGFCPFNAISGYDCRNFCGLGVDEDEEEDYAEFDYEE